ncbi:MAG: hypothetical protein EPN40_01920 [Rhodanobacteraceae bacterium]|nr:MAG: hypothetical protein EPN40_01920 [Rhodanobacteraceae bacterium]
MSTQREAITLDADCVDGIRDALLLGLSCLGEIEELCNAHEIAEKFGGEWPEGAIPKHPTGTADCVGRFANALRLLNIASH